MVDVSDGRSVTPFNKNIHNLRKKLTQIEQSNQIKNKHESKPSLITVLEELRKSAAKQVEVLQVRRKIDHVAIGLPSIIEVASTSENASKPVQQLAHLDQDTLLNNNTVLEVQTSAADQAILRLESHVANLFRQLLLNEGFCETFPPKLIISAGTSKGGAASLAQSPQFYNQMAICGDLERVFVVAPVFRSQDSYTHRQFTCLEVEMEINESYSEVMNIVDTLFVALFDKLNETCQKELDAIRKQYPFKPLKYLRKTLRLTFEQGIQMLKEAGVEVNSLGDLNTESERTLGKLVSEKYGTEFYILHRHPLAARPFYTMPYYGSYSNSFDVFIRGEKIISGSQRVHVPELLESRAKECGIDVKTISEYIDFFRYCAPPHGGFGAGLERVVMLFCGQHTPSIVFPA